MEKIKKNKPLRCKIGIHSWYYITSHNRVCVRCGERQTEDWGYDGIYWYTENKEVEWYPCNLRHARACIDVCKDIKLRDLLDNADELNDLIKHFIKFKGSVQDE